MNGLTDGIRLDWEVIDDFDVDGYNAYRSNDVGSTFDLLYVSGLLPAGSRSYVDKTAQPGREYTYKIGLSIGSGV